MDKCVVKIIKKNGSQCFRALKSKKNTFSWDMFPHVFGISYICLDKRTFIINFKNDI